MLVRSGELPFRGRAYATGLGQVLRAVVDEGIDGKCRAIPTLSTGNPSSLLPSIQRSSLGGSKFPSKTIFLSFGMQLAPFGLKQPMGSPLRGLNNRIEMIMERFSTIEIHHASESMYTCHMALERDLSGCRCGAIVSSKRKS